MTIKPDLTAQIPAELGAVHFVGIGGSGMSGIARLFIDAGHRVTGSDVRDSDNIAALRDLGAEIAIGHDAANVGDAEAVVVTGALWQDNPEYQLALERGLPVLHRSQALAWLIAGQRLVSVAGAHGKTTSTGMIITGLLELGEDPSFVNGGVIEELGVSSAAGEGDLFVVEADESDGSFLLYDTSVALVTNVDPDHLDHYGSLEAFEQAFVDFADRAREFVVISSDDPAPSESRDRLSHRRVVTFGEASDAAVRVHSIETDGPVAFAISYGGAEYRARLRIPGRHNAINAAGAFAVLVGLGFDPEASLAGISRFAGTGRRFELHGTVGGVSVYDDYAHHPTEVAAALSAARTVVGDRTHHRRAPAAPVQPHPSVREGVRRGARAVCRRDRRARRLRCARRSRTRGHRRARERAIRRSVACRLRARLAGGRRPHRAHRTSRRLRDHPRLRRRLPHRAAAPRLARAAGARMRARSA